MSNIPKFLTAYGKVQNVMFRQTIMRAAISRGVMAGATNNKSDKTRVDISLFGPEQKIQEIIDGLQSGKELNSWGARCTKVEIESEGLPPLSHEVNTENVDNIRWKSGIKFYL